MRLGQKPTVVTTVSRRNPEELTLMKPIAAGLLVEENRKAAREPEEGKMAVPVTLFRDEIERKLTIVRSQQNQPIDAHIWMKSRRVVISEVWKSPISNQGWLRQVLTQEREEQQAPCNQESVQPTCDRKSSCQTCDRESSCRT